MYAPASPELFREIKTICNGMLPARAYQKVYEVAKEAGGGVFVEVGTAHAAATIALALGLKAAGGDGRVYTFEKILGGSREAYGDFDKNIEIIKSNLRHFGVDDIVELTIGDVSETAGVVPPEKPICLFMLDADGRIDRDFRVFFNRVRTGAPVIIDDVDDRVRIMSKANGVYHVDLKMKLSWELTKLFKSSNLISDGMMIEGTYFGNKTTTGNFDFDMDKILNVYRDMIYTDGMMIKPTLKKTAVQILKNLQKNSPAFASAIAVMRRKSEL